MELEAPIPSWMVSHPDHAERGYLCAHPSGKMHPFLRFTDRYIPSDWIQEPCAQCCVRPEPIDMEDKAKTGVSMVALVWKEYDSFSNSLHSWKRSGLLQYVDETIIFINEKQEENDPIEALLREVAPTAKIKSNEKNIGIGPALLELVLSAENPLVLFLEKDWEVVEEIDVIERQMNMAKGQLLDGRNGTRADAVKFRSRYNAGEPNIGRGLCVPPQWDRPPNEMSMWSDYRMAPDGKTISEWWLPHLFCNLFHFDRSFEKDWPDRVWRCGCQEGGMCFDSAQCGWTNNPILFHKHLWLNAFYPIAVDKHNPSFEGGTYYSVRWVLPHFVVAQNNGFFRHKEINEHQ